MMHISESAIGDVTVLRLTGRLVIEDADGALGEVIDRLIQQGRTKVVLDLHDVPYIDSSGLGLLVSRYVRLRRRGGDLRLAGLTTRSAHLLEITKLETVFATFDSETNAVRSFAAA